MFLARTSAKEAAPALPVFAKLGTTDPAFTGRFTRSSRPLAPPSGGWSILSRSLRKSLP